MSNPSPEDDVTRPRDARIAAPPRSSSPSDDTVLKPAEAAPHDRATLPSLAPPNPPRSASATNPTVQRIEPGLEDRPARSPTVQRRAQKAGAQMPRTGGIELAPGSVVGKYVLERLIGSGGMGQVWKAVDSVRRRLGDPNPHVAIKLLNADLEDNPNAFVALQREAKKAQSLSHPNIVTVYDFDIDERGSGRAFMSMELLEGWTLDEFIEHHPRGISRAEGKPIILGMAGGLERAHGSEARLVHSDFKPSNVFLTKEGVSKVLDFGIARAVRQSADSYDAGIWGALTVAYASPEMIAGLKPEPSDDVFALGLVTYELLTGRHPFDRKDKRYDAAEARAAGLKPLRIGGLRWYEWQAIAKAIEFDRGNRFQSAGEFLRVYEGKNVAAKALGGIAVLLAVMTGFFIHQARVSSGPDRPFDSLPPQTQAEFRKDMAQGEQFLRFARKSIGARNNYEAENTGMNAAIAFGQAYALHVRNPDATSGLERAADVVIQTLQGVNDAQKREDVMVSLRKASVYYSSYKPIVRICGNLPNRCAN